MEPPRAARGYQAAHPLALRGIPEDLHSFARALESGAALRTPRRERAALAPSATTREPASRAAVHLTRLWAWEESLRFGSFLSTGDALTSNARASEIATRYELVTPWSGAVVLETDAEYPIASLPIPRREPDDPTLGDPPDGSPWVESVEASGLASDSPPPIPEPNTGLLVTLGIGLLALSRRRRIKR